ncbi:holin-like protein [Geoalkalibacter ferrihydriticus]|uniref:LrgA n=2 Tax=Geoalkalibacter ferrihydriticus TaxID=392333 RepID=A0A0C2DTI0_9BACT|nr:CidA/LrgA family protein [Geoalkalibacter ferrihydriticus]KIH76754.1 LrgA [Geoalkalibacter ferrihydriticus DSM 17813]SDL53384.1 holin-like protein [Geoalkalibacter ferrihydriticus]
MVRGMAILLIMQFLGEMISRGLRIPIPGNVIGMGLLLGALWLGWIKVQWLQDATELLLSHLALFFVPAGVGVMVYFDLIAAEWLPIVVAMVVSTFVVMAVTGRVAMALERKRPADD